MRWSSIEGCLDEGRKVMLDRLNQRDGHIHTPFCPHGMKDSLEDYVEAALRLGKREISFTEHFPMPDGVTTPLFQKECALAIEEVPAYIEAVKRVKEKYKGQIKINIGFEVDYIEGFEKEIKALLDIYGTEMEDGLLSVHFLKVNEAYYALDYLPDFEKLLEKVGNLEKVYDLYFETLLKSIEADLGVYKPKRLAHPTLIRIFNKKYPLEYENQDLWKQIIKGLQGKSYALDFNLAGLRKTYCGETYPSGLFLEMIKENQIPFVIGSDAHSASDIQKPITSI